MIKKVAILGLLAAGLAGPVFAQGNVPNGIPHQDHVFVIVMENHGAQQILNNPNEPYVNSLIASKEVNLATNYFAVGHPSLTNYLEIVGGSNFGIRSDNAPDWHNQACSPNLQTGVVNADNSGGNAPVPFDGGAVCPISGSGQDAETPAVDNWNEVTPPQAAYLADIDGVRSVSAARTVGMTIGDQLAQAGLTWKSYQESLPRAGADNVTYSDGFFTDRSLPPASLGGSGAFVKLYAAKHNPFVYFKSVQESHYPNSGLANVVGFEGDGGLYQDLSSGRVPALAFIAPNQCTDQHGRGNGGAQCAFDPVTDGSQAGLNPALIYVGDLTLKTIVEAIHKSPAWSQGSNAIVIVWDENDYSGVSTQPRGAFPRQNQNNVVLTVETNNGAGTSSGRFYTSFSLLKSLEAGFGLPCLNHACDANVKVMSDLFGQ